MPACSARSRTEGRRRAARGARWRRTPSGAGLTAAALLAALVALPAPGRALAPTRPADSPSFQDETRVVSIEVPVQVVGKDGIAVRGLTADDFTLLDEGVVQPLRSFRVVDLDKLEPPGKALSVEAQELDAGARRHFLLLFDLSFARPTAVLRARQAALDFVLHSLRPTDLAGVVTYSLQTGARLVVTFTTDRAQLARGIQSLGLDRVFEAEKTDPLRFVIAPPSLIDGTGGTPARPETRRITDTVLSENLDEIRRATQSVDRSISRDAVKGYFQSLADLAKVLGELKGHKEVVLFSEGFDSRLLVGHDTDSDEAQTDNLSIQFGQVWKIDNDNRYGSTQLQGELARMMREFRRGDCVIEAVNISGLTAGGNATESGIVTRTSGDEGLFEMANGTGGALFKDANDFGDQLRRVLNRTTVTYLLSFERSDLKPDGAFHRLTVKARVGAGVQVNYRAGYYAPRPFHDLDPLEKMLLASESVATPTPRADLDLNVLVSPFRAQGKAYVPVIVEVGGGRLAAEHKGDLVNLEIYAYVSDSHGQMQDFFTQKVAVDLKRAGAASLAEGIKYYGHLEVAPGDYRVRVLVRDADSGAAAVHSERLSIPAYDAAEPFLLPPFFIDSRAGWLMVREHAAEAAKKGAVFYPFTVEGEPYVPAALPELGGGGAPVKVCVVAYNLGAGDLAMQGRVTGADGSPVSGGSLRLVARTKTGVAGLDKLLATFQPTGLDAGRYLLQVAVTDPLTGRKGTSSVPFEVVR